MTLTRVHELFVIFTGKIELDLYQPLIDFAMDEVTRKLKPDADNTDPRLDFLAASIANYNYSQITCLRDKVTYTYAGTADSVGNSQMEYDFAKELMQEYYKAAAELLVDEAFVFAAVGGEES